MTVICMLSATAETAACACTVRVTWPLLEGHLVEQWRQGTTATAYAMDQV